MENSVACQGGDPFGASFLLTLIDILGSVPMPKAILEVDSVPSFQGRCRFDLIMR